MNIFNKNLLIRLIHFSNHTIYFYFNDKNHFILDNQIKLSKYRYNNSKWTKDLKDNDKFDIYSNEPKNDFIHIFKVPYYI